MPVVPQGRIFPAASARESAGESIKVHRAGLCNEYDANLEWRELAHKSAECCGG
jgi:hypothetical protein